MIFFVIVLLLIVFSSAKAEKHNEFNRDYISKDATNNIKGIFVILILFSHGKGYINLGGIYDAPYTAMQNHLNQMVVALFLFYSGYGIMEQIKKREFSYIMSIPKKRFPNLLLNFDISVILFALLWICLGRPVTVKSFLIALTSYCGIGNSSWYIFVTLVLYIFTFIAFFPIKWKNAKVYHLLYIVLLTFFNIIFVLFLKYILLKEPFWYNTAILYALGFWYSYFKDFIEKILMKNDVLFLGSGLVVCVAYSVFYLHRWDRLLIYEAWAVMFTVLTVMITMKVKIESNILKWFGEHIFSIYILQRIPMIILHEIGVASRHKYIFMIVSIAASCAIAEIYDILLGKLSALIWKPKKINA